MCRNIRTLYNFEPEATSEEVDAAALQYVRKISGFTKPSQANAEAFDQAVEEIAQASQRLLGRLVTNAPPKDRDVEAEKRRARRDWYPLAGQQQVAHLAHGHRQRRRVEHVTHAAAGLTPLRFTRAQVRFEPAHVEATLAAVARRLRYAA